MDSRISRTPEPPYYAVIFTSTRTEDATGYAETSAAMEALAKEQPGYLGIESAHEADGYGITVSYWASEETLRAWKQVADHAMAQRIGRERWYRAYVTRVCKVERAYTFEKV